MSATAASCELSRSLGAAQSSLPWCSPQDAKLLQAWALFESKHGNMDRAVRLLQRAANELSFDGDYKDGPPKTNPKGA